MENFETVISVGICVGVFIGIILALAAFYAPGRRESWTFPGHTNPPPSPQRDNWIRDGSKPPCDEDYPSLSETVLIVFDSGRKGSGWWHFDRECWTVRPNGYNSLKTTKVEAWQKFPDYEKI